MNEKMQVILVAFLVFLGCGGSIKEEDDAKYQDNRIVLKTGDHYLTLGDIQKKFKEIKFDSLRDEYEKKKQYVELSLERFLHIDAARAAGFSFQVDSAAIRDYLFQELYKRDAKVKPEITDNEVERYFERYGGEIQAGILVVDDSTLIDSIYNLLDAGANWDSLVLEHSLVEIGKKRGGSLGYAPFGQYDETFQGKAYDLKIGEYTRPFRFKSGWCIVKLFDWIKHSKEDLQSGWDRYKQAASNYSQILQTDDYKKKLLKDSDYRINWQTVDLMIQVSDSIKSAGSLPPDMPGSAYLQRSAFGPEQLKDYMVENTDGGITVEDYLNFMETYNPYKSPELRDRYEMELVLEGLVTRRIMMTRALELGLDTLQSYREALKYHEENGLIQEFNKILVASVDSVTEEDIKKYYDEHPDDFIRPEQVQVSAISLKTEKEALQVLEKLRQGAHFASMAQKYSTDKKSASEGGDLNFFTEKRYTEIFNAARGMNIGEIGGPVKMYGNYWIFKVTNRLSREPKPLSLARSDIMSRIYADRRIQAVRSKVYENKEKAEYFLDLDLLRNDLGLVEEDTSENVEGEDIN